MVYNAETIASINNYVIIYQVSLKQLTFVLLVQNCLHYPFSAAAVLIESVAVAEEVNN